MDEYTSTQEQPNIQGQLKTEISREESPSYQDRRDEPGEGESDVSFDNKKVQLAVRDHDKKTQKGKERPSWVKKFKDFLD